MSEQPQVTIFTDGGALTNPGPGGYGVVLLSSQPHELSGGFRLTTNNRMELLACIAPLSACKVRRRPVQRFQLRRQRHRQGLGQWRANAWLRTKTEKAENIDLWEQLLALCSARPVDFRWVKGHAGDPDNERCDQLSVAAAHQSNLPPDEVYELGKPKHGPSNNWMT